MFTERVPNVNQNKAIQVVGYNNAVVNLTVDPCKYLVQVQEKLKENRKTFVLHVRSLTTQCVTKSIPKKGAGNTRT